MGCGEEEVAFDQGGRLVSHLRERLAFRESRRVGEWVLATFKNVYGETHQDVAAVLNNLGSAYFDLDETGKAKGYFLKITPKYQNYSIF